MSQDSVGLDLVRPDVQSNLIRLQMEPDDYGQTCFGGSFFKEFFDLLIVHKQLALNGAVNLGEQAVLDGVPFGTIGRVVADDYLDSEFFCQVQQFLFEGVVAMPIGTAAVAEQQDVIGVRVLVYAVPVPPPAKVVHDESGGFMGVPQGHIALVLLEVEDAVRDDLPCGKVGVIVVKNLWSLLAQHLPAPVKVAQTLFFLGVYAQRRVVSHQTEEADQVYQNLELLLPVRALTRHQLLRGPALAVALGFQNSLDRPVADRLAVPRGVSCGNFPRFEMRPFQLRVDWATGCFLLYERQQPCHQTWTRQLFFFSPHQPSFDGCNPG